MSLKVFLTGSTGYIGGSVLTNLLKNPEKYKVTALVRQPEAAAKLKTLNVTPLLGSLDDVDLLIKAAEEADVVLSTAHADHLPSIKAIIYGLSKAPKPKVLIHTSGTGVLSDPNEKPGVASDLIYSDLDMKSIHALPISRPHKEVDQYIFDHSENIDSAIIAPPTIYGLGTGPFNKHSIQIPGLIRTYVKLGQAGNIGKGLNIWNNVHVEDLADFYILLLENIFEGKADVRKDGWYFAENGQHTLSDLTKKIAEILLKKKLIKTATVRELTDDEINKHLGILALFIYTNSRGKAERSRKFAWKPKKGDIFSSLEEEIDTLIADKLL